MNNFDNKNVYNLLCSKLLLQYLGSRDKAEFSSSCKFIFQKCIKYRLSICIFSFYKFVEYTSIINTQFESQEKTYNLQLEYINKIATRYKHHLLYLNCRDNHNYYILEYFSMNFNCLRSLYLLDNRIPQKSFKNIIKNLPNLQTLTLIAVGIRLEENNLTSDKFEFPRFLKKLKMSDCYQFNCNSNDPVDMTADGVIRVDRNSFNLDISNITINTVKNLTWNSHYRGSENTLNELLTNNVDLETLKIDLFKLNADSLSIISNNRNLTKLVIFSFFSMEYNNIIPVKFKFIKSIKLSHISNRGIRSLNQLLQNCPNLEELKYDIFTGSGNILHPNIQNSKNLKKLSISHSNIGILLSAPLPDSTLEHLELISREPFKIKFSIFNNLTHLKRITFNGISSEFMNYDYNSQSINSNYDWREVKYSNSVQFWKIF